MMATLKETLEQFQASILEQNPLIEKNITGPDSEFKKTRLGVYQEAYFLRLIEVLADDFDVTKKLLGAELFEDLAQEYLEKFPSTYFSVRGVGERFSYFLKRNPEITLLIYEMAEFEWALRNTIDAQDAPYLTLETMATIEPSAWETLRFKTHPSLEILSFFHKVPLYWQHIVSNKEKPDLNAQPTPTHWIVWRFNHQSFFRELDQNQFKMLEAIQSGADFSLICEKLCELMKEDEVVPFAVQTLQTWIKEGVLMDNMKTPKVPSPEFGV